jgi:transposase
MWTTENRGRYDRSRLRYPSDLTDDEWALVRPLIPPAKRGGNKRRVDERAIVDGLMYILSTGCQWRAMPKDLPPRSTIWNRPKAITGAIVRLEKRDAEAPPPSN